jgi:Kef-type K+ transport system membrane component KefB
VSISELFLAALLIIFSLPYLVWRLADTDNYAPLVVVQIGAGILLGPGIVGEQFPQIYQAIFTPPVLGSLNGLAWWGVMLFVWLAGLELDLAQAWTHRRESVITACLALSAPLVLGSIAACAMVLQPGWMGPNATQWQFVLGIAMSCAVTALPILVLFLEKLHILRTDLGQRILRYASLDDIFIWGVLALILMDYQRAGLQLVFLLLFALLSWCLRAIMPRIPARDRLYLGLVWLALCALGADVAGLHFMVGAFLAGVVIDADAIDQAQRDALRNNVLLLMMPVFFLSTGLRTQWSLGGMAVLVGAAWLLLAAVSGKLLGVHLAGRLLGWKQGEASLIAWLLQTKALIMIIFCNILLDKGIISNDAFTALLLMALASTMLTVPVVRSKLARLLPPA